MQIALRYIRVFLFTYPRTWEESSIFPGIKELEILSVVHVKDVVIRVASYTDCSFGCL
jgi:hypothetical protein